MKREKEQEAYWKLKAEGLKGYELTQAMQKAKEEINNGKR